MTRAESSREASPAPAHWTRPIWRDPRALRDVERSVVIDQLRHSARAAVLEAMQRAGLWQGAVTGPRRFGAGQRALQVASALFELVPDEYARLLRANALMVAQRASVAAEEFARLERECGDRRMRGHATTGLAIAATMAGERALGLARCRAALASPFEDISISGALSLVVQASRAGLRSELVYALDAVVEREPSHGTETVARLLSNYATGCDGGCAAAILGVLGNAGRLGAEVEERLRRLLA